MNPYSFYYGSTGNDFTTIDSRGSKYIAFVSTYAKTSESEDRAELYADLMYRVYKKTYMGMDILLMKKRKNLLSLFVIFFQIVRDLLGKDGLLGNLEKKNFRDFMCW